MTQNENIFENTYRQFEDRFRGSEQEIKRRLSIYLPLLAGIRATHENRSRALDLGSGRGEWLSLIADLGWNATGVEPNSIAEAANEVDAHIIRSDALDYLRSCPEHSFGLVTAFHVVEHLETNYLLQMLEEIRRVLIPGGLMILETPNPENLTVGSWSFHLDPTHKAPIPPVLLQYHVERAGFPDPEIVRVNGAQEEFSMGPVSAIIFTLFRSGLDYAILARTKSDKDEAFANLIHRFALQTSQRNPANTQALSELARISDQSIADFRELLDKKNRELADLYNSSSWRITRPLRALTRSLRTFRSSFRHKLRVLTAEGLIKLRKYPRLKSLAIASSRLLPPVERRLRRLAEPWAPRASLWSIDVDPQILADWTEIVRGLR